MIKGNKLTITWCLDDIIMRAKERDVFITDYQAIMILHLMDKAHDCTIGINWDVIDITTDIVIDERK